MLITLARALTRSRIILDELDKLILKDYLGINSNKQEKEQFISSKDKFNSLFDEYVKIKTAISKANTRTVVNLKGEELTIIEIINKKTVVEKKIELLIGISSKLNFIKREEINNNSKIQSIAEERIKNLGEVSRTDDISERIYKSVRQEFPFEISSCYGEGIEVALEKLSKEQEELNEFLNEIDFVLSEVNAVTHIEI